MVALIVGLVGFIPAASKAISAAHLNHVDLGLSRTDALFGLAYLSFYLLVLYFAVRRAYGFKRRLLLGDMPDTAIPNSPRANVYAHEHALFEALDRRKRPETRLDYQGDTIILGFLFIALELLMFAKVVTASATVVAIVLLVLAVLYMSYLVWASRATRRNWR